MVHSLAGALSPEDSDRRFALKLWPPAPDALPEYDSI